MKKETLKWFIKNWAVGVPILLVFIGLILSMFNLENFGLIGLGIVVLWVIFVLPVKVPNKSHNNIS